MADKPSPLPSIDDDLSGRPKQLRIPKMAPRPSLEDETVNANTADLARNWPAVSTHKPDENDAGQQPTPVVDTSQSSEPEVDAAQPTKPETVFDSIRLNVPAYLNKQLSRDAVEKDCTKTHLILQALAKAGYEIDPADMAPDRRGGKK
jgi:hypothetical protein